MIASELVGDGRAQTRRWAAWLQRVGASTLSFNPYGPFALSTNPKELRTTAPRLLARAVPLGPEEEAWLDLDARESARARARSLLERYAAAEELEQLRPLDKEWDDRLMSFRCRLWFERVRIIYARLLEDSPDKVRQLLKPARQAAEYGDPYLAIDGLLETARVADRGLGVQTASEFDRSVYQLALEQASRLLSQLSELGYRSEEVARWRT